MIAAFFPSISWAGGWIRLHGLMMFVMTFFGAAVAIPVAWLLKKTLFKGETPPFVMELPSYKWPSPGIVALRVYDRAKAFVMRAGTLIFATTVLVWAASYFPGDHSLERQTSLEIEQVQARLADEPSLQSKKDELVAQRNAISEKLLEESFLGRLGKAIEPVVRPLGWDWRIGVGVLASFPAREVIVATLGTIYSLGGDVDESDSGLQQALRDSKRADGLPVYSIPVALSIMVFFALCAQCASTLMVIRRETNSWRWSLFTFGYMTTLAYLGAFAIYQIGSWWAGVQQ
jgi:ferrous iron transport protein B